MYQFFFRPFSLQIPKYDVMLKQKSSHISEHAVCARVPAGAGGWSPLSSDRYQWLQVDLGERTHITAVSTQGRYGSSDWLTAYLLMFSDTGHNWRQYRQEDSIGAFPGNSNADSVVQHKLQQPVIGRYVRLIPLDWNPNGRIGLRLETFGCPYNSDVVSFDGRSSLLYRLIPRPRQAARESVSLIFKALSNSGTLLHAEGRSEHSLSLQLQKGRLLLTLRRARGVCGQPAGRPALAPVTVEHHSTTSTSHVDKNTLWVQIHQRLTRWDHDQMSVGADQALGSQRSINRNFHGCLENLGRDQRVTLKGNHDGGGVQFRTWNEEGLLLTFDLPKQGGAVWLYLSKTRLHLQIHKSGRAPLELSAGSALDDGQWHSVELTSRRGHLSVSVDGGEGDTANASPPFPVVFEGSSDQCVNPFKAFQGCMRLLTVDNQPVDLKKVQQRLMGNYSHLQIDMCGIIDRCSLSHFLELPSTVTGSDTGYSGATCHSSIYEQSCEAYKHRGNTSGLYYIDDQTWTVVQHNNTDLTRVRPSPGTNQHSAHFEYTAEEEQLTAIISQSEHCEQEVIYLCRKSRLLNTPDGPLLSWWVGGPGGGQVQTYWGGAPAGSQQCACGLQQNCVDPKHYCNCDAGHTHWYYRAQSAFRVGPLRCHGDKNVWNAAFFDKETSYLHFPTFHGELSADVSFLFKTTSSSGVFLENLGIKDFIRIELSSSSEVVFSFDVGNGPLEVRVQADSPLNDNRWHRIRAERNVKEASLRLDELPAATREAADGGHGVQAEGFSGCIRSLQLNGVTLDLDQRARITPGVQAGCPGHCSSYGSLCKNQGRCVERALSFSCDCSSSAFTGAFCHTEVSASFKSGTSVSYTFRESVLNGSSVSSDFTPRGENISPRGENISPRERTSP
ncbi:hypothetical protein KUCAC02_023718 [Chaenocephalus aceratus]|uniref:Uncharacterized protein n=1 Tax=Chaenocephalus aceratus TaxID=36190 RepID=A0ACB9WFR1_CHAAC|nr:hypothetical protein KUCAC02_023718 [Chaenocephalus aceratus]